MKRIKYKVLCYEAVTDENDETTQRETLADVIADYSEEALILAEKTAYNDEYTIEDDGVPSPETTDDVLNALLGVNV